MAVEMARWIVVMLLIAGACSSDPTTSDEYLQLEEERAATALALQAARGDLAAAAAQRDELEAQLSEALAQISETLTRAAAAEESLADSAARQSVLEAEVNRPWPQDLKDLWLRNCTAAAPTGRSLEQAAAGCGCLLEELELRIYLTDFLIIFLADYVERGVGIDPVTGAPAGTTDDAFGEGVLGAAQVCLDAFG